MRQIYEIYDAPHPPTTVKTMNTNEKYMLRCIELARQGEQNAAPNPMVGAVIVHDDRIIGEGYHVRCGQAHAEVNAVNAVRPADRPLLRESTLYVSLEPCAHFGKTPPCAQLIIRTGIPRVVVGCQDPFAKVQGRGIQMLREAGVEVTTGVLEEACRELNKKFIVFHEKHRPYITLKWARSRDGFIDRWHDDEAEPTPPVRLSTPRSQIAVHHLRARHKAILVGHNTLRTDRPRLTLRAWSGQNPQPVVLGRVAEGELPAGWQAFADIDTLLESLHRQNLQSLLVEGGRQTLQSFIDTGLWDEAFEELSATDLDSGVPAPRMPLGVEKEIVRKWNVAVSHWINK